MSKQKIIILLDDKAICTKKFLFSDSLAIIRQTIKGKINNHFQFLDPNEILIDVEDESDFSLENIIQGENIKIKSIEKENEDKEILLKIFLNNKNICSFKCRTKDKLTSIRELIYDKIKNNFQFLDLTESNVEMKDEQYYSVNDILKNEIITISTNSNDFPPPTPSLEINSQVEDKKEKDFSKYEIIKIKKNGIIIYKYSNPQSQIEDKLVYQYFYDDINDIDHNSNHALIVLFCGKTGDGKTTAINAFFNIIKGIRNEDNYRFILISEPSKEKGQAESQTNGIHIYYLKDYNNRPVILIDSQGYGDTRGKLYDEMLNDSFRYVFSNIIDHINIVCFISKSSNIRLDSTTKYIFSSVTSLFSEDISDNFIILATFASKDTIDEGPAFAESIKGECDFLKIEDRLNEKWWYAMDSKCILDQDTDRLTKYSFEQIIELYEEKVKKLRPKSIKNCSNLLQTRYELKVQINCLKEKLKELFVEHLNLDKQEETLNKISNKIKDMENEIKNFEEEKKSNNLSDAEIDKKIKLFNENLNKKLNELNNQYYPKTIKVLKKDEQLHTICMDCKKNCHSPCDCSLNYYLNRCIVFSWGILDYKQCEKCKCKKTSHKMDYCYWAYENIQIKKDNNEKIEKEREKNEEDKMNFFKNINKAKNNYDKQKNLLTSTKNRLLKEKEHNENEKNEIRQKILKISNEITFTLVKLQKYSQRINDIAMNKKHLDIENEYIDSLEKEMQRIGIKNDEQTKLLEGMKEKNRIFKEVNEISEEDIFKLDDCKIASKLGIEIPMIKSITPE